MQGRHCFMCMTAYSVHVMTCKITWMETFNQSEQLVTENNKHPTQLKIKCIAEVDYLVIIMVSCCAHL